MNESKRPDVASHRPDGVTVIVAWYLLLAGGLLLVSCGLAIPFGMVSLGPHVAFQSRIFGTMLIGLGMSITLSIAVLLAVVAWGLWHLRPWARIAAIVLAVPQLPAVPWGTAAGAVIVWYLGTNDAVIRAFSAR